MMGKNHKTRWKRLCGLVLACQLAFQSTTQANTPTGFEGVTLVRQMGGAVVTAGVAILRVVTPIIKLQTAPAFTTIRILFEAEKEAFKIQEHTEITKQNLAALNPLTFVYAIRLLSRGIGTVLGTTVKGTNMFIEGPCMGLAKNYFLGNPNMWTFLIADQAATLTSNFWKDWHTPQQDPWSNVLQQGHKSLLDAFFVISCGTCFWGTKFLNPRLPQRLHRTLGWKETLGMMTNYLFISKVLLMVSQGTALGEFYDKISSLKKLSTVTGFMVPMEFWAALREPMPTLGLGFSKIATFHLLDGGGINGSHWVNTTKEWETIRNTAFDQGVAMIPVVGPLFVLWDTVSWINTQLIEWEGLKESVPQWVQRIWYPYEEGREKIINEDWRKK